MIYVFEVRKGKKIYGGSGKEAREKDRVVKYVGRYDCTRGAAIRQVAEMMMKTLGHIGHWRDEMSRYVFLTKEEGLQKDWINTFGYPE